MDSQQNQEKPEDDALDDLPVDLDKRVVFAKEIPSRAIAVDRKTKEQNKQARKKLRV